MIKQPALSSLLPPLWALLAPWLVGGLLQWGVGPSFAATNEAPRAQEAAQDAFLLNIEAPEDLKTLLTEHLQLLRYRADADLTTSELRRLLRVAQQDAQALLATQGYFSPTIQIDLATPPGTTQRIVTLRLEPGLPTLVREVQLLFSGPIADDQEAQDQREKIKSKWSLQRGTRFTQAGWDEARQTAKRLLSAQRYRNARITQSLADIDPDTRSARLFVTLDSGPAFKLGPLRVSGLQNYDEERVRRLAHLREGDDYDQEQLVQAQRRLTDSGFFEAALISLEDSHDPSAAPVNVLVREAKLKKLVLGIGASTNSGARFSLEHTHHRVSKLKWQALSKLALERNAQTLSTELTAPPDESLWRWVVLAQLQAQTLAGDSVNSQLWRIGRNQNSTLVDRNYYLQYDRSQSADKTDIAQTLSANYSWTWRRFDQLPFPTDGWGLGLELGAGSTLGGQNSPYSRLLLRWRGYQPLGRDDAATRASASRLAWRVQTGAVLARADASLPQSQLFWSGGDTSVRGYALNSIGASQADGSLSAGRFLVASSLEWQRPIRIKGQLSDWESTLFIDTGVVTDPGQALQAKTGVGAGARWKSPLGPLQIDLAYGVATRAWRLHFNIGVIF